jgi:tetratricopeptide (TPR) repeat protein
MNKENIFMSEDESVLLDILTVKAKNKAYILLDEKDEKTMRRAAEYYDEHGSGNERMMAYYLLGCVYRDLRDMPMAFDVYERILQLKDTATASECLIMGVEANMKLSRWDDAKEHLRIYETKSGKIDSGFHALKGFEQYYYYKGLCLMNDGKTDSAKLFLDKRLKTARNWNAKQNAYKGLKYYYENMGMTDSALYYSNQQIMARDSDYYHKSNDNMQYLQSIYEYSHHKNMAIE